MKKIFHTISIILIFCSFAKSQTTININVPWISQYKYGCGSNGFTNAFCGHTASEMVFAFYENRTPSLSNITTYNTEIENEYGYANNTCGTGTADANKLVWLANQYGYTAYWFGSASYPNSSGVLSISNLKTYLSEGIPVIIQVYTNMSSASPNITHWMVLRQIDETNNLIYVNDPGKSAGNNKTYSLSDFEYCWNLQPEKRCVVIMPKSYPINNKVEIYAGSTATPKQFKVWFTLSGINSNFTVSQFKIGNTTITPTIINEPYDAINHKGTFNVTLTSGQLAGLSNQSYDLSFDIN